MTIPHTSLTAETLLEHESFVRAVARGVLEDEHAADDVVQDVFVKSLDRGPRKSGSLRGWLAAITRNAARDSRRESARRTMREERAARTEAQESVATAFERLSMQREVIGAILALQEPYRSVILLRYYHDLEPSEVAARLGVKPGTIRTQLVRGHELLRSRLDAHRDRRAWSALLLPESASAPPGAIAQFESAAGALSAAVVFVACILLAGVWLVSRTSGEEAAPVEYAAVVPARTLAPGEVELSTPHATSPKRESLPVLVPITAAFQVATDWLARAELFDRTQYKERDDAYGRATFSFVHGVRGDSGLELTRNDLDVLFDIGSFWVHTVTDDTGLIVDLGLIRLKDLASANQADLRVFVAEAAAKRFDPVNHRVSGTRQSARVELGHTYFVWTRDADTNEVAAFEVLELDPFDRCLLDWYATTDGRSGRGSTAASKALAPLLHALRIEARLQRVLRAPRARLQLRAGSGGGNPNRIDLAGCASQYVQRIETQLLDPTLPVSSKENSLAYCDGGFVPESKTFVVTRVIYSGSAHGDGNGAGGFRFVLGGRAIVELETTPQPMEGVWNGSVEITPGDESATFLEVRNSSNGDAVLEGYWKP